MEDTPASKGLVGVVVGAVILFGFISLVPVLIACFQRRRTAERLANEVHNQTVHGSVTQVERWLEEQTHSNNIQRYREESCPICLSPLLATSSHHTLASPEPAHISLPPKKSASCKDSRIEPTISIIVLNRCNHAFHTHCLRAWSEYRQYRCPMCQSAYFPTM